MSQILKTQGTDVCAEHGPYEYTGFRMGTKLIGNICPVCQEARSAVAQIQNRVIEERNQLEQWAQRLRAAGVPASFHGATFESYVPTNLAAERMLQQVSQYAKNFERVLKQRPVSGLVFTGALGTGKTHIACSLILELLKNGHSAAYLSCPQFLLAARETRSFSAEEKISTLLARYTSPRLLVLDEFGAHTTQDIDYQNLYAVIDGRYQRNLPTILVTNLRIPQKETEEQIVQRKAAGKEAPDPDLTTTVDQRIIERVHGSSPFTFRFDWPSNRGLASQAANSNK